MLQSPVFARCEHVIRKWMSVEDESHDGEDKFNTYGDVCTHVYMCVFPYIPTTFIINHK